MFGARRKEGDQVGRYRSTMMRHYNDLGLGGRSTSRGEKKLGSGEF